MTSSGTAASYADCVASLRNSLKFLDSSVSTLDDGVADFPRLVKVLKSVRVRFRSLSLHLSIYFLLLFSFLKKILTLLDKIALRTRPPTNPRRRRSLPPRRNRPTHSPPPLPRRRANRAPRPSHRDAQSSLGATTRSHLQAFFVICSCSCKFQKEPHADGRG